MAAGSSSTLDWKESIVTQLRARDRRESLCFQDLVLSHTQLFEKATSLKNENLQLSIQNEMLRKEVGGGGGGAGSAGISSATLAAFESKLLAQQEELTELHRKRGENAQTLIDLNKRLQEREKIIAAHEESLAETIAINTSLRAEIQLYKISKSELESLNQFLRDEHQALQLAFTHLEEKLRKVQEENREMVERLMKYKSKDAEKMNEENENFLKKRHALLQKELEDAAKDTRLLSPDTSQPESRLSFSSAVPTTPVINFDAHDGEISAVRWSPVERILATGGADRKVKLWSINKGTVESRGVLVGCNYTVMSVEFDSTGSLILGTSNDFATRIWTVNDQRLRHTLTGHSNKVLAAKFLGDQSKVVTGSHDRTLKLWDLKIRSCVDTLFVGSSCNDLVVSGSTGTTVISGHFDKTIRVWDVRSGPEMEPIKMEGRVTSLDLSKNRKELLLACVRDDTLRIIDLRMNKLLSTFSADGFKVGSDWTRAMFSSDGEHVAVGSNDGSIYIWNTSTSNILPVLKEHTCQVQAVAWHPHANWLASVDKSKKAIIWSDA